MLRTNAFLNKVRRRLDTILRTMQTSPPIPQHHNSLRKRRTRNRNSHMHFRNHNLNHNPRNNHSLRRIRVKRSNRKPLLNKPDQFLR